MLRQAALACGRRSCQTVEPALPAAPLHVSLREITADTVRSICGLTVATSQTSFVAPNAVSLAQALFAPEAWYRAVYLAEQPVGFVMLADESLRQPAPLKPQVSLWRFMIDSRHQRLGIGTAAMAQVIEHVQSKKVFSSLWCSYVPGDGCPEQFYLSLGFRHTGQVEEGEVVLELQLGQGVV